VLFWTERSLGAYVVAPARMDALAMGGLLALAARGPHGLTMWRRHAYWAGGVSGAALAGIFLWRRGFTEGDPVVYTAGLSLNAIFFGSLLTLAVTSTRDGLVARGLSSGPLTLLGRYSYALYVFHEPLIGLLSRQSITVGYFQGFLGSHVAGYLAYVLVAGGTSIILAALSWQFYESRILKLKDRFPYEPAESFHSPHREVNAIRMASQV